jgi:glycerate-2-kinase
MRAFSVFEYLNARGAVLMMGPTGQNLRDLRIVVTE